MVIQKHGELVWELVLFCLELLMLCGHVQLGPGATWCQTFCFGLYIHLLNVRNLFSLNASLSKTSIRCRVIFRSRNRQTSPEPKPLQINLLLTLLPGELLLLAFESKVTNMKNYFTFF
jgi:hypothetical protein